MALLGKTPTISNLELTSANTEYSYVLPLGCKKFIVQCRTDDIIKLAYVKNESGSNYITIPEGASKSEDVLCLNDLILYLQSPTAGVVAEIETWVT